jgi:DNA helicase-2/ATP-dependent DNA helicase PcrA
MPENIIVTTFTRKAAEEIRSRLIEWGMALVEHLRNNPPSTATSTFSNQLDSIDINRFITGTLDSICEETLTTFRNPGDPPPVLVEGFVGNALLAREGMFRSGAWNNQELEAYLAQFTVDGRPPHNFGQTILVCRNVVDRLLQDCVNVSAFANGTPHTLGRQIVVNSLGMYRAYMARTNRMDFAGLEEVFLSRLTQGRLQRFTGTIRAILVDEYQDTNPLQESIYFQLSKQTRASLTVVGDDDQSLYRFRGSTVELFCHFSDRRANALPGLPAVRVEHLIDNYRSTPEIVSFFNDHIAHDPAFLNARVQPPKPQIVAQIHSNQIPVLGLFRHDPRTLAHDLAAFLNDVFRGPGRNIVIGGQVVTEVIPPSWTVFRVA